MILDNKTILVTGGTGSLGKVLVRRLISDSKHGTPKKVIVMSRDEGKQHNMRLSFTNNRSSTEEVIYSNFQKVLEFRIGDVRDFGDVNSAVRDADIIINAAALKQVPTCEYFPEQAVKTNVIGASNIIKAINQNPGRVETLVGISTDKAAKPINVMGMTKAIQERIFLSANILNPETRCICVRYGNVLASRGSVIPLFHHQIGNNVPITVTSIEITRFLLTLNQAVDTIYEAISVAESGEIIVPNAPSVNIMNVAKIFAEDSGIDIEVIGIRPGEKLHEIMVSEEESSMTIKKGDYYAIQSMLPELFNQEEKNDLDGEFSSAHNILDLDGTRELLEKNNLLPGMENPNISGEMIV